MWQNLHTIFTVRVGTGLSNRAQIAIINPIAVFVAGPQYEVVSASTVKQMIDFEPYSFYGASLRHWDFHCPIYCC